MFGGASSVVIAVSYYYYFERTVMLTIAAPTEETEDAEPIDKPDESEEDLIKHNEEAIDVVEKLKTQLQTHIFISYSREDTEFVVQLNDSLQKQGIRTWIDRSGISGGDDWTEK